MGNRPLPLQIETADQIHDILESGDSKLIQRLLYSVNQFPDPGFAEMVCQSLEEHADAGVRLAVAHAYSHLARTGGLMFEDSTRPFFERELSRVERDCYSKNEERELLRSYQGAARANDWDYDRKSLEEAGVLCGCGAQTSWAYVATEINTARLPVNSLHNLAEKDWSYSISEPCGNEFDNIDGMITFYCCTKCQVRSGSKD